MRKQQNSSSSVYVSEDREKEEGKSRAEKKNQLEDIIELTQALVSDPGGGGFEQQSIQQLKPLPPVMGSSNIVTPVKRMPSLDKAKEEEEEFTKNLHFSIFPLNNFNFFLDCLKKKPQEIHSRHGILQESLLHRACRYGHKKAFDVLLSRGAVLTARNKCGNTPLHLACQFGRAEMVKELVESGVPLDDVDDRGDQAIHFAAQSGCMEAISIFIEKGVAKCVKGFRGNSIVHYAAQGGQKELLERILKKGCSPNAMNELTETPLHMAAAQYTYKNNKGVDLLKLLLSYGADLNARTHWGDTAAHYAGHRGTIDMLKYLIEQGIEVDKNQETDYTDFFEKHQIPSDERKGFNMSLLQKVAKSGCQYKAHVVLEHIMSSRNKLARNMYYSSRGVEGEQVEMNSQEMSFLYMSNEMNMSKGKKCGQEDEEDNAFFMFLKYSPDSLTRLFDLCIVKPCFEQIQGQVYFDFFLFNPHCKDQGASELSIINALVTTGKERFLIHPLFEIFLKLKWYKTWTFYLLYIIMDFIFLLSLSGYTLVHFGKFYEGFVNYDYEMINCWWYLLAFCHGYMSIIALVKALQVLGYVKRFAHSSQKVDKKTGIIEKMIELTLMSIKDAAMPILLGLVLYGSFREDYVRYFLAVSEILASYQFMTVISRLPRIGLYVHMLSKVMLTVLNFFASYFWHFLGYAIAFHILIPTSEPFRTFTDSFIKVLAMLMGEYEYTINFVSNPASSYMAKILFVVFVIDMSVVLMNLVLGLAISDIEELQRNSAVRRMMQESCTVLFMENLYMFLGKIPGCKKLFCSRITNEKSCLFQDVTYLDLVDLDKSPQNSLILEKTFPEEQKTVYTCPNHIVVKVINVIKTEIQARRIKAPTDSAAKQERDLEKVLSNQRELMEKLEAMEKKMAKVEEGTAAHE